MPQIVAHRINTLEQLQATPSEYGIEFDVRESERGVVVTHDPWTPGVALHEFLSHCNHAFYIVNIKCEGIEETVLKLLWSYHIEKFFLLDCSFPMIVRLVRSGEPRVAIRLSEYESIYTVLRMSEWVTWVWIDVFSRVPVTPEDCRILHDAGFKLCLVSPELQGRPGDIADYKRQIGHCMDMVCTKYPTEWRDDVSRTGT